MSIIDTVTSAFWDAKQIADSLRTTAESNITAAVGQLNGLATLIPTVTLDFTAKTEAELKTLATTDFVGATAIGSMQTIHEDFVDARLAAPAPTFAIQTEYTVASDNAETNYDAQVTDATNKIASTLSTFFSTHFPLDVNGTELTLAQDWVINVLTTGGAMDAAIENQYWQRDRDRSTKEATRLTNEAVSLWASRGFPLPPGAAAGAVNNIQRAALEQSAASSREVAIKKFEVETQLQVEAVKMAISLRQTAIAALGDYIQHIALAPFSTAGDYAKTVTASKAAANQALDTYYNSISKAKENLRGLLIETAKEAADRRMGIKDKAAEYRAKANVEWLVANREQPAAIFKNEAEAEQYEFAKRAKEADLTMEAAKLAGTMASSALNGIHATAQMGYNAQNSAQYNYSGEVSSDVLPIGQV